MPPRALSRMRARRYQMLVRAHAREVNVHSVLAVFATVVSV